MTTLRDEDITTTSSLPGGDADQGDSGEQQVDPAGVDPAGSDTGGGDADQGDSTETHTEITFEPRKGDADSSDS